MPWSCVYLVGSSIKTVGQEFQLSDSSDLCRHLNHPDQLFAVQTPQVQQVGAPACYKAPTITVNTNVSITISISMSNEVFWAIVTLTFIVLMNYSVMRLWWKLTLESLITIELVSVCNVSDRPCDSKGLVGDFGSTVRDRELVFAWQCVALPSKDRVITETAEDGVTERQKKHLQHKQ